MSSDTDIYLQSNASFLQESSTEYRAAWRKMNHLISVAFCLLPLSWVCCLNGPAGSCSQITASVKPAIRIINVTFLPDGSKRCQLPEVPPVHSHVRACMCVPTDACYLKVLCCMVMCVQYMCVFSAWMFPAFVTVCLCVGHVFIF